MPRRILSVGSIALLGFLCASCASYWPQHFFDREFVFLDLNQPNFRVVASGVQASAECEVLFPKPSMPVRFGLHPFGGFGGEIPLGSLNLLDQAMDKLHKQFDMENRSMQFHNTTVEWTLKNYIVYGKRKVTITTDIIEYTGEHMDYRPRTAYQATSYPGASYEETPSSATPPVSAPEPRKQKQSRGRK